MAAPIAVALILGLLCGGLVNYFADELPLDRRLAKPSCPQCATTRTWLDFFTGAACRTCGRRRGWRPWIVVLLALVVSVYTRFQAPAIGYYLGMLLFGYLAVVTVIDLEHRLILGSASVFGGLLGFGLGWYAHGLMPTLFGGLAGLLIMGAFYYLGVLFSRVRADRMRREGKAVDNEEALGSGDVTLALILGLLLGWPLIWFGLLLGVLVGGLMGLLIVVLELARGRYAQRALTLFMPYGPAFVLSAFLIMYMPKLVSGLLPH